MSAPKTPEDPLNSYEDLIVHVNGEFVPAREARVSVFDHGLLYGDGVFEGIRLYSGCVFKLDEHIGRLHDSARHIMLEVPVARDELREIVCETCRRNGLTDGYIRLVVTRGVGGMGLAPWLCPRPTIFCIAASIQLYPEECYENGLDIVCAATRRSHIGAWNARCKSLNYLNNIMAKIEAKNAGALEALMLDQSGYVIEATGDNVFLVKDGCLVTPPTYQGNLRGITRDFVIELAGEAGVEVVEEPITTYEVYTADEVFLTGTAAEVVPVARVDSRPIGDSRPGPVTRRLMAMFRDRTTSDGVLLNSTEAVRS